MLTQDNLPEVSLDANVSRPRQAFAPAHVIYMIDQLEDGGGEQALFRIIQHLPRDRFTPSLVTFHDLEPSAEKLLP